MCHKIFHPSVQEKRGFVRAGQDGSDPLVSVILAVHNREASVARAVRSVLAQTYSNVELIVVDDGSTDNTRRVVESFGARVTLIPRAHAGVYAARNAGLRRARGELVAFIDSDDAWLPDRLAAQVPLMRRQGVGLVFGDAVHVTAPREGAKRTGLTSFRVSAPRRGRVADHFMWCNFVPTCTALVRRSCLLEAGDFCEACELSADYLAWFRIALSYELDYVDRVVAEYTVHSEGISYDLGRSLASRIALFRAELRRTSDARVRALVRRLLFNLSLHLALAVPRGRARNVSKPLRLAWRTARSAAGLEAAQWAAAFALDQMRSRKRRLFL
ncbi:MAG: glycosyltransferase [Acidobacteriota bacterium]|nr:glycosyltransferase [Acidobacteriota bacterium]